MDPLIEFVEDDEALVSTTKIIPAPAPPPHLPPTRTTTGRLVVVDLNWYHSSGDFTKRLSLLFIVPKAPISSPSQPLAGAHAIHDWSYPSTTTNSHATTPTTEGPTRNELYNINEPSSASRRLIHLLIAAAEAISGDQKSPHLARVILVRLREIIPTDHASASGIERLASHFTEALLALLDNPHQPATPTGEVLIAFKLLHDMSPCVSFGHLTANQAILEAIAGERRVHILDYNIGEGVQWASLIQALISKSSPAAPHLRITALTNGIKGSASGAQEVGRRLSAFAASVGQPFSFRICRLDHTKRFTPAAIKVVKGEALVVNCVLQPAQLSSSASLTSFLTGAAALGPRILTIIEEESSPSVARAERGFVSEFMDEVERYMAIWESLETGFPMQGRVREMVERVILRPRIAEAVARAYGRQDGGEVAVERCGDWMAAVGFERLELSSFNVCQAQLLIGLFNDGFCVDKDSPNKLALRWKSRRLLSASVWGLPPPPRTSGFTPFRREQRN
ncbi:nodulation-signaling pathway 2 protein-like [Dendrobium catenatum]|uniref:nodulation-signaling pathway 2 protein-like n=1 Tax=Dendrobium catenatum TaxID=906689 RepID=UPI0010A099C4|nr:nodulation-signaling pathway 2 protein-like [Dendrobium catenatum]